MNLLRPSLRARRAAGAVVERVVETYLKPGVLNLAPGSVGFVPPKEIFAAHDVSMMSNHRYGACIGETRLLSALRHKFEHENELDLANRDIVVTPGANLAFVLALLATCDVGDEVVLFAPYYFSHLVAIQLLGLTPLVLPSDASTGAPDLEALRAAGLGQHQRIRAVVHVNPGNPSGAVSSPGVTAELMSICAERGAWLLSDEAYEHFTYGGDAPFVSAGSVSCKPALAPCVLHLHTFSKSYGMAGWRVGSLCYPQHLHDAILKAQDTLPTHATRFSQEIAARALEELGTQWVRDQVQQLQPARSRLWDAARPLYDAAATALASTASDGGADTAAPSATTRKLQPPRQPLGAFYYMLPLPPHIEEEEAVRLLAQRHGLLVLPGSAFGAEGKLRLAYGCLDGEEQVAQAGTRLERGVGDLLERSERAARGRVTGHANPST